MDAVLDCGTGHDVSVVLKTGADEPTDETEHHRMESLCIHSFEVTRSHPFGGIYSGEPKEVIGVSKYYGAYENVRGATGSVVESGSVVRPMVAMI